MIAKNVIKAVAGATTVAKFVITRIIGCTGRRRCLFSSMLLLLEYRPVFCCFSFTLCSLACSGVCVCVCFRLLLFLLFLTTRAPLLLFDGFSLDTIIRTDSE